MDSPVPVEPLNQSLCFRFKVSGELPLLHVKISDQKIHGVVDLVHSIPLPSTDSAPSPSRDKVHRVPVQREQA